MVHTVSMTELAPSLIAASAGLSGAVVTALVGYLASRERYSQRMERLANVRVSVKENEELVSRLDSMIDYELTSAVADKINRVFPILGSLFILISLWTFGSFITHNVLDVGLAVTATCLLVAGTIFIWFPITIKRRSLYELLATVLPETGEHNDEPPTKKSRWKFSRKPPAEQSQK